MMKRSKEGVLNIFNYVICEMTQIIPVFYAYNLVTVHFKDVPVVCELQVGFTQ